MNQEEFYKLSISDKKWFVLNNPEYLYLIKDNKKLKTFYQFVSYFYCPEEEIIFKLSNLKQRSYRYHNYSNYINELSLFAFNKNFNINADYANKFTLNPSTILNYHGEKPLDNLKYTVYFHLHKNILSEKEIEYIINNISTPGCYFFEIIIRRTPNFIMNSLLRNKQISKQFIYFLERCITRNHINDRVRKCFDLFFQNKEVIIDHFKSEEKYLKKIRFIDYSAFFR